MFLQNSRSLRRLSPQVGRGTQRGVAKGITIYLALYVCNIISVDVIRELCRKKHTGARSNDLALAAIHHFAPAVPLHEKLMLLFSVDESDEDGFLIGGNSPIGGVAVTFPRVGSRTLVEGAICQIWCVRPRITS